MLSSPRGPTEFRPLVAGWIQRARAVDTWGPRGCWESARRQDGQSPYQASLPWATARRSARRLEFVGMDDELRNARLRRGVVVAMLYAAEHALDVLRVCAAVDGDDSSLRAAISAAFGFDDIQAGAILNMQIRRFTPSAVAQYQSQLADIDALLRTSAPSDG